MMSEIDLQQVEQIIRQHGTSADAVIPILQDVQTSFGYLPPPAMDFICRETEITPSSITGVSTFYTRFRHKPVGKHTICVCTGTACHVKGAPRVQEAFERHLNIPEGDDTDPDGLFTIEEVACLGCCTLAPVIQIDGVTYGHLSPRGVGDVIDDFLARGGDDDATIAEREIDESDLVGEIRIGLGSCCVAGGSDAVHDAVKEALNDYNVPVRVRRVGCVGMCHQTPLVELAPLGDEKDSLSSLFAKVTPDTAADVVLSKFQPKGLLKRAKLSFTRWIDRLAVGQEEADPAPDLEVDQREGPVREFLADQRHLATEECGRLDPIDIEQYMASGGFKALARVKKDMSPDAVIALIDRAGLRGRGGAGFPSARKWQAVSAAEGDKKYIVCNGDEGDPGAFMDRMLLESFPYRIIEAMAIAAYAVGASEGFLYIRAEYPLAVKRISEALAICDQLDLLGDLKLSIKEGAGAFVCGEETALLESIEGRRGMPRLRPPYPAESGLWGRPTLVNNVETYALIPWIVRNGADRFALLGTEQSKGTKVFALAGKVRRGGLIEVPMGITIREIVERIGGGLADDRKLKAVQVGGPSGGCIPAELADTPVDYEALDQLGAIMGSGGLVVLDQDDCMVDIARYFLRFTQDQSCGRCTFCRVGTREMLDILDHLCEGTASADDLERLERLAHQIKAGSLCGLGSTAPNPVLSTLRHFRHEYEAHVEGRCPAGRCPALSRYEITEKCIGCAICAHQCPVGAIPETPYRRHYVDMTKCIHCDNCRTVCPADAVEKRS